MVSVSPPDVEHREATQEVRVTCQDFKRTLAARVASHAPPWSPDETVIDPLAQ